MSVHDSANNFGTGYPQGAGSGGGGITQLTGSVTAGPGSGSQVATIANTAVTPGSYTSADITVGADGRLTSAANGGGGGSSGLTLLEQHTASASSSLDFTAWYSSSYDEYQIEFVGLQPGTNAADLYVRMSTNGGSSYDSGANYAWAVSVWRTGAAPAQAGFESGQTEINLTNYDISNVATASLNGYLRLSSPASTTLHKIVFGQFAWVSPTGGPFRVMGGAYGTYISTTAVNAFQVLCSSGNIAAGTIRVYGLAK